MSILTHTTYCKYCNKNILNSSEEEKTYFCNDLCQTNYFNTNSLKRNSKCIVCEKEFLHFGDSKICSKTCNKKYIKNNIDLSKISDINVLDQVKNLLNTYSFVVKKGWGLEIHICNNEKYCLKYLIFIKDKKFSYHFHEIKHEMWTLLNGKMLCEIADNNEVNKELFYFEQGNKIEVLPNHKHQLTALEDSIVLEVSTPSYEEDSFRIRKGD